MDLKLVVIFVCLPYVGYSFLGTNGNCVQELFIGLILGKSLNNEGGGLLGFRQTSCRAPYVKLQNGRCYLFSQISKSWHEARIDCNRQGGHLVIVNNEDEHDCIRRYLLQKNNGLKYWTALNDIWNEDDFMWDTKNKILTSKSFVDFQSNEPNSLGGEAGRTDCILYNNQGAIADDVYRWGDWDCEASQRYICEKRPGVDFKCNTW